MFGSSTNINQAGPRGTLPGRSSPPRRCLPDLAHSGRIVAGPHDIPIGQVVVQDPFGNVLVLLDSTTGTYRTDDEGHVTGVA